MYNILPGHLFWILHAPPPPLAFSRRNRTGAVAEVIHELLCARVHFLAINFRLVCKPSRTYCEAPCFDFSVQVYQTDPSGRKHEKRQDRNKLDDIHATNAMSL
ncbi:hypothetical protein DSO57_1021333 [Entomophthora muscae]|uniref:Uncharacterized protein n=1 Tax=Entomophthora muscae TaxID=34485 RepID=A0ACC2SSB6_9FUNG|nr:hypothetical protein DSO57_1021333 [Entomophthora muscae]